MDKQSDLRSDSLLVPLLAGSLALSLDELLEKHFVILMDMMVPSLDFQLIQSLDLLEGQLLD